MASRAEASLSTTEERLVSGPGSFARARRPRLPRPPGPELAWAIAFVIPYAAVFCAFVAYPLASGLWMASDASLYGALLSDPLYARTVVNTAVFVGLGVNLEMALALLLSGFFMRRRWWIKALLPVFILPWVLPEIPAYTSFHWMLIGEQGLVDSALAMLFGIQGPLWFNERLLALGSNIVAHVWKWLPFWTVTLYAGRLAIPQDIYESADVDGATGVRRFIHVILPLLGSLYLVCTLLATLWTIGDFTAVSLVSQGAPSYSTDVLATLGIHYAFDVARPPLGVAAVLSALPALIPIAIILMRTVRMREVQL